MTEELIYTLSKVPGLKVIAQTSAMSYKGTTKPIREIGRELSVGSVLEGSVRKAGERLRITVQLIDAASEEHLWAARYDRELADVFEIQTEIAQSVAGELKGVLVTGAAERPTENIDAYKEYLKGRQFWARRTKTSLYKALAHFEAAVGADPNFAKAHSGIADTYTVLANHGHEAAGVAHPKAKAAAEAAIALDPNLAEAHASLGILHLESDHDTSLAERELRRAVELNPNYATAYHWLGLVLEFLGKDREAGAAMERALELDPLAHISHVAYAGMLLEAGDAEKAKTLLLRARDLEPDYPGVASDLAQAEMILWNWCGAEDALDIGLHRNPNNTLALGMKMHLSLILGDVGAAREALEKGRAESIPNPLTSGPSAACSSTAPGRQRRASAGSSVSPRRGRRTCSPSSGSRTRPCASDVGKRRGGGSNGSRATDCLRRPSCDSSTRRSAESLPCGKGGRTKPKRG